MKRAALGLVIGVLALLVGPTPAAHAHTGLILSMPDDGAHLATVPSEVLLTFSEDLLPDTVVVSVADSSGLAIRVLDLTVDGSDVTLSWPPGLRGTAFTVNYRVVSQDGHPVEGSIGFTVDTPADAGTAGSGAATAASPASTPDAPATTQAPPSVEPVAAEPVVAESGPNALLTAVAVGLAVGLGAVLVLLWRRRGSGSS